MPSQTPTGEGAIPGCENALGALVALVLAIERTPSGPCRVATVPRSADMVERLPTWAVRR